MIVLLESWIRGKPRRKLSAISNQQSAISNQQSAISNQQSADRMPLLAFRASCVSQTFVEARPSHGQPSPVR
jgi:hypothetical protein